MPVGLTEGVKETYLNFHQTANEKNELNEMKKKEYFHFNMNVKVLN